MNGEPAVVIGLSYVRRAARDETRPEEAALTSLMLSCLDDRMPEFSAGDATHGRLQRRDAAIRWQDHQGAERALTLCVEEGRWDIENPPADGPSIDDHSGAVSTIDKMLQAISEGWNIPAFRPKPDIAVISWDRMSHGNHPAVVMQRHPDTIIFYYEAPDEYGTDNRQYAS